MLAVARTLPSEGAPIDWIEGSALDLPFPTEKFDLALCQLGLQFFPDQGRALREMRRVLSRSGRIALSVYSPIERTPGANAFVLALDSVIGTNASSIKRGEHSFNTPDELRVLMTDAGFADVDVRTVVQDITFPSVLDYVRFQLLATPMAVLLGNQNEADRLVAIKRIASETAKFSNSRMLAGGGFSFGQEAYVGTARTTS
jgi:SAM-dependent methyltransferase